MDTVIALHDVDADKASHVASEMRVLGAPVVRVIEAAGVLYAVEGTHRLAAAAALGLAPELVRLSESDCPIRLDLDGDDREWAWDELVGYVTDTRGGKHGAIYRVDGENIEVC